MYANINNKYLNKMTILCINFNNYITLLDIKHYTSCLSSGWNMGKFIFCNSQFFK